MYNFLEQKEKIIQKLCNEGKCLNSKKGISQRKKSEKGFLFESHKFSKLEFERWIIKKLFSINEKEFEERKKKFTTLMSKLQKNSIIDVNFKQEKFSVKITYHFTIEDVELFAKEILSFVTEYQNFSLKELVRILKQSVF